MNKWNLKVIKNGEIINIYECDNFNLLCSVIDYFINNNDNYDYEVERVNNNV